jgi:hypothetical protein
VWYLLRRGGRSDPDGEILDCQSFFEVNQKTIDHSKSPDRFKWTKGGDVDRVGVS